MHKRESESKKQVQGLSTREPVSVVVPAYNEEDGITSQIETIRRVLSSRGVEHEIIIVDDGSIDRSGELASQTGARVITHPKNRGYGASLKTGISAARNEIIIIIDADGTYPVDEIPAMIDKLEHGDMVVGARTGENVNIPFVRRPAKWILNRLAELIAGERIPDLNSGLRVFRRTCVKQYFSILPNSFSFTSTITLALFADGYHIIYHPINYFKRVGTSKIVPRHFMDFVILVLRMAMLFQPLKIFVPLAFFCGSLGVLKVLFDCIALFERSDQFKFSVAYQQALSTSAILLLLSGLQLILIGMVSDALLRRIAKSNEPLTESFANSTDDRHEKAGNKSYDGSDGKGPE